MLLFFYFFVTRLEKDGFEGQDIQQLTKQNHYAKIFYGDNMILNSGRKINIFHSQETASTNDDAKAAAKKCEEGALFTADRQTCGRGRMGRSFFSPDGGLYASLLLKPRFSAENTLLITVCGAVAAALAIEEISSKTTEIKWVNDIFIDGKKVCGILTEGAFNENGAFEYAVLGLGVNLTAPEGGFPKELENIAGALFKSGNSADLKEKFLKGFCNKFFEFYENIEKREYLDIYRKKSMLIGKTVSYIKNGKEYEAKVTGITEKAELTVFKDGKSENLNSGEVKIILK